MFKWMKKDPVARLQAEYGTTIERARDAQRSGDIKLFATLTTEAEVIAAKLDAAQSAASKGGTDQS
jgi:hypothetical protein